MPYFDLKCESCGKETEVFCKYADIPKTCECGGNFTLQFYPTVSIWKCKGAHKTEYKKCWGGMSLEQCKEKNKKNGFGGRNGK